MTTNHPPHTLAIDDDRRYRLECHGVTDHCRTWEEANCPEAQTRDEWDGDTWFDWKGEDTAHGVTHTYIDGAWSHPIDTCWLASDPQRVADVASDLRLPPGRHEVVHTYDCGGEGAYDLELADAAVSS